MKTSFMIRNAAIASAVALACGAAFAGTLGQGTPDTYSAQGNANAADTALGTFATFSLSLGQNYTDNDQVRLTLGNGVWAPLANLPVNFTCSGGSANKDSLTFQRFERVSSTLVKYRVTQVTDNDGNVGVGNEHSCAMTGFTFQRNQSTVQGNDLTISATSAGAGTETNFDPITGLITVARIQDQFSLSSVTAFNGQIDVSSNRETLVADDGALLTGNEDILTFTLSDLSHDSPANMLSTSRATFERATVALSGDFSFADINANGQCSAAEIADRITAAAVSEGARTLTINSACSTVTYVYSNSTRSADAQVQRIAFGGAADTDAPFDIETVTGTVAFTHSNTLTVDRAITPGGFGYNGFIGRVNWVPFGTGFAQVIELTNRSTTAAEVRVRAVRQDGQACPATGVTRLTNFTDATAGNTVSTVAAGGKASLAGVIGTMLTNCGFTGRYNVSLDIYANVNGRDGEVFAMYATSGDRVPLINDSNNFDGRRVTAPGNNNNNN
jgi:hypothetical protein